MESFICKSEIAAISIQQLVENVIDLGTGDLGLINGSVLVFHIQLFGYRQIG